MKKEAPLALLYTAIILTLMEYFFIPPRAEALLNGQIGRWLTPSLHAGLIWSASCIIGYVLIPLCFIYFVGKSDAKSNGFNFSGFTSHFKVYLGLYLMMLPVIYLASTQHDFQRIYPFIPEAKVSTSNFIIWEIAYVLQFFALEAFFRGYLLFTLDKYTEKWTAIAMMTVPYVMIHFHKPVLECLGAAAAGMFLGWLALRYRSWIGGAILHALVGISMDLLTTV